MAITQIQGPRSLSGQVGSQLGEVLSQNLQNLALTKTNQLQQKKLSNVFNQLGLPGNQLAHLPDQDRQLVLKELLGEYGAGMGGGGEQDQMMQALMGGQPGVAQGAMPGAQGQQQGQNFQFNQPRMGSRALKRQHELGKEQRAQLHELEKAERPFYNETLKEYEASRSSLNDINRIEHLINAGKLRNPTEDHFQRWLSKMFKINLKDLRGADTEEFEKLTAGFIKNARQMFGSRVTNFDLQSFLKTIPTLATSAEGNMRLLGSMKAAAEAQQLKYKAMRRLMNVNGGRLPPYAGSIINEMIQPELDDLSKRFISGELAPELSEAGKKAATRNWYLRPLKVLGGLVPSKESLAGAIVGSAIPGVGHVAGGLAGGILGKAGRAFEKYSEGGGFGD